MPDQRTDVLLAGPSRPVITRGLAGFTVYNLPAVDRDALLASVGHVRAMAVTAMVPVNDALLSRLAHLDIIASFGVGYDHIDAHAAARHGVIVTNTPDVLTEEVADTALGLLLCTVRELPQAERYLRAGKWRERNYPLSRATLRNRTVGLVGMGRIGAAIARRLEAVIRLIAHFGFLMQICGLYLGNRPLRDRGVGHERTQAIGNRRH